MSYKYLGIKFGYIGWMILQYLSHLEGALRKVENVQEF